MALHKKPIRSIEMAESIADIRGQKIKELVEEMKLYNNPKELEEMRRVMRKNVPLSMRGYLLAYLYMTRHEGTGHTGTQRPRPQQDERRPAPKQAPENAVSFYINVGKASKGTAKELAEFVCEKANLKADDIVTIAYKPNYSFIFIKKDAANGVIEAVNGQSYKNRKVKMNYSKEKDEN